MQSATLGESRFRRSAQRPRSSGFSLAEVLMGTVILAFAVAMGAAMNGVASFGVRSSTTINDRDALVDADVAAIRALAEAYNWCSGSGSIEPVGPCAGREPTSYRDYYAPPAAIGNTTNMENFVNACRDGTLNTTLIAAINARAALPGIVRVAETAPSIGTTTNVIRIRYSSSDGGADGNSVSRSVVITPAVTAWCP
jgi:hypothetical protein